MITTKSPSYRALSGVYQHADASLPRPVLPVAKILGLYSLTPLLQIETDTSRTAAITKDLAQAQLAGLDGFCFVVSAERCEQEIHVLRGLLSHPSMLPHFALRLDSTLTPLSEPLRAIISEVNADHRYLPDLENLLLPPTQATPVSAFSAESYRDILMHEAQQARSAVAVGFITAPPNSTEAGDELAALYGATLRFIRRATALSAPHPDRAIVLICGWSTVATPASLSTSPSPALLRILEHTARSRWAAHGWPLSSVDEEYHHYLGRMQHMANERLKCQALGSARYQGRKPWLHSLLNTLRSFELLHRPYRWAREILQEMRG